MLICLCGCTLGGDKEPITATPTVRITFPEGYTALQIAGKLEEEGVCTAAEFLEACKSVPEGYTSLVSADFSQDDVSPVFVLEGFIFPDTYDFYVGEGAKNALSRFLKTTKSRIPDTYFERASELGLTMNEVFTLASVIQSECGVASEMGNVSAVFHNRLKNQANGFPYLGSDVTRQYIEKKMKSYIDENGLSYDDLFAAYCTNDGYDLKTKGLPLAPICNPGINAIKAALWPSETDYLYFFTRDGAFHYFHTYNDFLKAWNS